MIGELSRFPRAVEASARTKTMSDKAKQKRVTDDLQDAAEKAIRDRFSNAEAMKSGMPPDVLATSVEIAKLAIELSRLHLEWLRVTNDPLKTLTPPERNIERAQQLLLNAMKVGCAGVDAEKARIAAHQAEFVEFDELFKVRKNAADIRLSLPTGEFITFRGFSDADLHKGRAFLRLVKDTAKRLATELMERQAEIDKGLRQSETRTVISLIAGKHYQMREMLKILLSRKGSLRKITNNACWQLWFWSDPHFTNEPAHEPLLQTNELRQLGAAIYSVPRGENDSQDSEQDEDVETDGDGPGDLEEQGATAICEWAVKAVSALEAKLEDVYTEAILRHFSEGQPVPKRILVLLAQTRQQSK